MPWQVSLATGLPTSDSEDWDGAAAAASIFAWAGWPDDPDPAKAGKGFVFRNTDDPELKGSFKAPVARVIDGTLTVVKGGVRAAKSRVPQADVPADVKARGIARLNGYWDKWTEGEAGRDDAPDTLRSDLAPGGYETLTLAPGGGAGRLATFVPTLRPGEAGLEGYLVPFYTLADRGLYFVPGALKRSAKENIGFAHHLFQHWPDLTLGYHAEASEDERGFRVVVKINEDKALGADVMSDYRFGIPYAWSIGFDTIADRSGTEADDTLLDRSTAPALKHVPINELRAITQARWWESSTVTWGAIPTAGPEVVQARGRPFAAAADPEALAHALRTGRLSPEQRRQLAAILTAWQSRAVPGPDQDTRDRQQEQSPEIASRDATALALAARLRLLEYAHVTHCLAGTGEGPRG